MDADPAMTTVQVRRALQLRDNNMVSTLTTGFGVKGTSLFLSLALLSELRLSSKTAFQSGSGKHTDGLQLGAIPCTQGRKPEIMLPKFPTTGHFRG